MQEHLDFVQPARQRQAGDFAIDAAPGDGGNRLCRVVDRNCQLQIPTTGVGDVELADVGKFGIERLGNGVRFVIGQLEGAGIGEDDAFLVEAQVHRVGAQPVAVARFVAAFAEQAQGAAGRGFQAEAASQCSFVGLARKALKGGAGEQPLKAGRAELAEGELVGRLGPDQFGDKQGEMHICNQESGFISLPLPANPTGSNIQKFSKTGNQHWSDSEISGKLNRCKAFAEIDDIMPNV